MMQLCIGFAEVAQKLQLRRRSETRNTRFVACPWTVASLASLRIKETYFLTQKRLLPWTGMNKRLYCGWRASKTWLVALFALLLLNIHQSKRIGCFAAKL